MMRLRALLRGVAVASTFASAPAIAAAAIDPEAVAKLACESSVDGRLTPELLAEAVVAFANVPASRVISMLPPDQQNRSNYLAQVARLATNGAGLDDAAAGRVLTVGQQLELALKTRSLKKVLIAEGADVELLTRRTLFSPGSPWSLRCVQEAKANVAGAVTPGSGAPKSAFILRPILRKTVDDLAKASDKGMEGAGSFSVGFTREKTLADDGARKTSTNLQVNGAVGLALGNPEVGSNPLYLYGEYTLGEKRSKLDPAPAPTPNDNPGKDDVDVLELGLAAPSAFTFATFNRRMFWEVRGRAGGVLDFAKDARRLFGNVQLEPGVSIGTVGGPIGIGYFGKHIDLGFTQIRARLRGWFEGDLSHVLEKGTSDLDKGDELLSLGGVLRFDVAPRVGAKRGIIASAQRRHLWTVGGTADNIDRWDFELGYRFLVDEQLAVDLKTTYAKGEERKSLDDQDIWKIEFGLKL